ncbi:hypothetical protein [uncultured Hoeflea sp.]|uniref:hypothetical protein n=1 Tax=uncultured Hoeflea sp. TaxID=538666 RepID=UPI0030ED8F2F
MSYYDHATMIAYRLGPWAPTPGPPLDVPSRCRTRQAPATAPRSTETPLRRRPVRAWFAGLQDRLRFRVMPQNPRDP